ncbi:hypothetical protein PLICRDRAFT_97571 [Plicaturopsis crispa FD-325 SS-3]|nr:hypothetical protein PLICRDRAFT_97571 [Plicaturopsis crispa FD-325 SS-3]
MTVTEICTFPTSEAYRADQSTVKPFAEALSKTAGFVSFYHGVQVEDPAVGYLFIEWETFESHQTLIDSPAYGPLIDIFRPLFTGPPALIHAKFDKDPTAALTAPATEYAVLTLKEGGSFEVVDKVLAAVTAQETPAVRGAVYGPSVESDRKLIMAIGWDSVEVRLLAATSMTLRSVLTLSRCAGSPRADKGPDPRPAQGLWRTRSRRRHRGETCKVGQGMIPPIRNCGYHCTILSQRMFLHADSKIKQSAYDDVYIMTSI